MTQDLVGTTLTSVEDFKLECDWGRDAHCHGPVKVEFLLPGNTVVEIDCELAILMWDCGMMMSRHTTK